MQSMFTGIGIHIITEELDQQNVEVAWTSSSL